MTKTTITTTTRGTIIHPWISQSEQVVRLSTIDQLMSRKHMSFVLCFDLKSNTASTSITEHLKQSLAVALAEAPQFAGFIQPVANERQEVQLYIGPDTGVLFRCYNDPNRLPFTFDDLTAARFPLSHIDDRLLVSPEDAEQPEGVPVLVLQANFIPGGLLLAVQIHHTMTDMSGFTQFLRSWSRHMQASSLNHPVEFTPFPANASKRSLLSYGPRSTRPEDVPEWRDASIPMKLKTCTRETPKTGHLAVSIWRISRKRQEELRTRASSGACSSATTVSTVNALLAFLWRHICLARWGSFDGTEEEEPVESSVLLIPVDLRLRMKPRLPASYLGNASMGAYVDLKLHQLCRRSDHSGDDPLPLIAREIQTAITGLDPLSVRQLIALLNRQPTCASLALNLDFWPGPDILISEISNSEMYTLDWGPQLGQIASLRLIGPTVNQGHCIVSSRQRDGGLEVVLHHERKVIEGLQRDGTFTKFVTFVC